MKEKIKENKIQEEKKYGSKVFGIVFGVFCLLLVGVINIEIFYSTRVAPNTFLGNASLANVSYEKLEEKVKTAIKKFQIKPMVFSFQGKKVNVLASQIGLQWDIKGFVEKKNMVKKPFQKTFEIAQSLFQKRQEKIDVTYNWDNLENILKREFRIKETHDAFLD